MSDDLERALLKAVEAEDPALSAMAAVLLRRGGKRLRPMLLSHCAAFGSAAAGEVLQAAAAIELLHVASLQHDDVMDQAAIRRGGPSANSLWGNATAALVGTHIVARAMALLAKLPPDVVAHVADATFVVCTGQLRETEHAYDLDLDVDTHVEITRMKTASLFELPCRIGAVLAGLHPAQIEALSQFGRDLGIAFQLVDDLLDFEGETETLGKPARADLARGIYSYPVLLTLRSESGPALRTALGAGGSGELAADLIRATGALGLTHELAQEYCARARRALHLFSDTPIRSALLALSDVVAVRDQ